MLDVATIEMEDYQKKYKRYSAFFENALRRYCAEMRFHPDILAESMRYSLLSGGKRVRPVLFFAALELFGLHYEDEIMLAIALESIHTYSLIHDDLPAMDNDDYRRGNPSNHMVYGEANAILAGDALLSEACSLAFSEAKRDFCHLQAAAWLIEAAGPKGMVAGQSEDLRCTGKDVNEAELEFIYAHKTGKLIAAPIVMAAILAGESVEIAECFGMELGRLFQMTDDLLDVKGDRQKMGKTLGKDKDEDKATCIKVYGLERSEIMADKCAAECMKLLKNLGRDTSFLEHIVRLVRGRDN